MVAKKKNHYWKKCKICKKKIYLDKRRKTCGGKCAKKYHLLLSKIKYKKK